MVCRLVGAKPLPEPMLENCYLDPRNRLQWNVNRNLYIFIQENPFENVVWKMAAILSRPQCVKGGGHQRPGMVLFCNKMRSIGCFWFSKKVQSLIWLKHYPDFTIEIKIETVIKVKSKKGYTRHHCIPLVTKLIIPPETKFRGGILDSPCSSVRLSVRPSVRPSVRGSVSGW